MSDLFAAGHEDYESAGPGASPKKVVNENVVAPKGAGHKKFQPSRLFDEDDAPAPAEKSFYKTNPARYDHFDIGDSYDDSFQHRSGHQKPQDVPIHPKGGRTTQHNSQWEFEDFVTPEKTNPKVRGQDVVHFSIRDGNKGQENTQPGKGRKDQETHFDMQDDGTPVYQPTVPQPRKDADTHFNFTDESTPGPRRIIGRTKAAAKLYADPVFDTAEEEEERPLAKISNNARQEFHSYWDMGDESLANGKSGLQRKGPETNAPSKQSASTRGRERNDSFWDF